MRESTGYGMDDRATVKRGKDVFEAWRGVGVTSDDGWLVSKSCPAFDQGSAPSHAHSQNVVIRRCHPIPRLLSFEPSHARSNA